MSSWRHEQGDGEKALETASTDHTHSGGELELEPGPVVLKKLFPIHPDTLPFSEACKVMTRAVVSGSELPSCPLKRDYRNGAMP